MFLRISGYLDRRPCARAARRHPSEGQTVFFSSGDTGMFCYALVGMNGVPAGIPRVAYPASSPYGTALISGM